MISNSVVNHITTVVDDYHYRSISGKKICMIGNEIRTEDGFPEVRLINYSRQYLLKKEEVCEVFGLTNLKTELPPSFQVIVYIINYPFVCVSSLDDQIGAWSCLPCLGGTYDF